MPEQNADELHPHYYRYFHGHKIDLYRIVDLFGPMDAAQQHALKKLMFAGDRPHKDKIKDIKETIDSLRRWLEMLEEDETDTTQTENDPASEEPIAPILASVLARARGEIQTMLDREEEERELNEAFAAKLEGSEDEEARGDQPQA